MKDKTKCAECILFQSINIKGEKDRDGGSATCFLQRSSLELHSLEGHHRCGRDCSARPPQWMSRELRSSVSKHHRKRALFIQQHSPFSVHTESMVLGNIKGHRVPGFQPNLHQSPD